MEGKRKAEPARLTQSPAGAWAGLDPVDMNGKGKVTAAMLKAPAALVLAEPEAWNMQGNANAIAAAVP